MANEQIVPTGPQGTAVKVSTDNKMAAVDANAKPAKNADTNEKRDADGTRSFGGGGTKVELTHDYWPAEQPDQVEGALSHRENRIYAGEVVSLPNDEAMDLIEAGKAKRAKDAR